jgi:hypothetical protein
MEFLIMNRMALLVLLFLAGCATVDREGYRPKSAKEKKAFLHANRSVGPNDVRRHFHRLEATEVVWAGIIKEVQFKEAERTIQVAFRVEHRHFDWSGKPYRLSSEGEGEFVAGQSIDKPASISRLRSMAKPGYMLVVYGKPYRMVNGVIHLVATSVRPISVDEFRIIPSEKHSDDSQEMPDVPEQEAAEEPDDISSAQESAVDSRAAVKAGATYSPAFEFLLPRPADGP